ncbi:serine/threonine-protein kinase ZRK1-like [Rosa rugosa]|uniref:serine/threonine-protein kinase ZRK1-like n=1 Tax=Rosa rugosa TaxID=74645 RepID=UPI002B406391|nr:serine/threonine-protein kinase ZRK1-like [Rosa rugosa]
MPSNVLYSLLPCLKKEGKYANRSFLDNGSKLLEDLIASCDGKSNPIRHFSADELIRATNNFHPSCLIQECRPHAFRGSLGNRLVIIKTMEAADEARDEAIRNIVISVQMSTHKNVLKLLGCCLEFPLPVLVHEYATLGVLNKKGGLGDDEALPWKTRIRIAKQVASAITYLHTAFPRPIIHRDLRPDCILLDEDFVPKLCDFSYSITIPPKQSHVKDIVKGTVGYLDPVYVKSAYISEKTDVYSFGVILLVFLTGRKPFKENQRGYFEYEDFIPYLKLQLACEGQIQTIVDPKILEELGEGHERAQQQLHDFLSLALSCTQLESEARPDMIDVAKELVRIEKSILPS